MLMVAVDPGDVHCGWAVFGDEGCVAAGEYSPEELLDWLWTADVDVLVVEGFRLYPKGAGAQSWSSFRVVEVIGALGELARRRGIPVVVQPALVKKPTSSILRATGKRLLSRGKGGHAKDAEVHGWAYLMKTNGVRP